MAGPSDPPDQATNAYRRDLADVRLAGRVIASHYVEGIDCSLRAAAELRTSPSDEGKVIAQLGAGARFELLDDTRGWAWGYAGDGRLVGYVPSSALA